MGGYWQREKSRRNSADAPSGTDHKASSLSMSGKAVRRLPEEKHNPVKHILVLPQARCCRSDRGSRLPASKDRPANTDARASLCRRPVYGPKPERAFSWTSSLIEEVCASSCDAVRSSCL